MKNMSSMEISKKQRVLKSALPEECVAVDSEALESVEAVVHTCFDKHFAAVVAAGVAGRLAAAAAVADHIPDDHTYAAAEESEGAGDGLAGHKTDCSPFDNQD